LAVHVSQIIQRSKPAHLHILIPLPTAISQSV
jgi:hypothetical protein